jgi:dTDP-glucose 4,6-dehydratase
VYQGRLVVKQLSKRVLVTGAGGFIGSHLVEALASLDWQVRALVHYNSRGTIGWLDEIAADARRSVEILAGDIRDGACLREAVRDCQVIMHLAALIGIPYSYIAPAQYVDTNILGTLNVLQAAKECGIERVIHTSTSEVYGTAQSIPITESHPMVGQSPYSASKIGADQLALSFHRSFGTKVAVIRPFNTYGPRQSTRAVIPTIITQLLSGARSIALGALTPTRDFNFVADTVNAFIATADANAAIGEVINVGSNFEISIAELVDMIADVMGVSAKAVFDPTRLRPAASEVERLWADNSKATRLIGWRPQFSGREGLRRGLEMTVKWFKSHQLGIADLSVRYAV